MSETYAIENCIFWAKKNVQPGVRDMALHQLKQLKLDASGHYIKGGSELVELERKASEFEALYKLSEEISDKNVQLRSQNLELEGAIRIVNKALSTAVEGRDAYAVSFYASQKRVESAREVMEKYRDIEDDYDCFAAAAWLEANPAQTDPVIGC